MKFITYATKSHKHYQERTYGWFQQHGFYGMDYIKGSPDMLGSNFKTSHAHLLSIAKGGGYWCWKSEIILTAMESMDMGEGIIYADSNVQFYADPQVMFHKYIKNDLFIMDSGFMMKDWTKRDCFVLMSCDEDRYWQSPICWAGFIGAIKSPASIEFLQEYQYWCSNYTVISDEPSILRPDFPSFVQHRHDQSILTNLLLKHNIPMISCLKQDCMYEND